MAAKRKVNNLLALAVLSVIVERPMHRYEIASMLKQRGKDRDMDIKWGSLYTVVQNMAKAGFLEAIGSERDGARPERVIYRITDAGRAEMRGWTTELIADPELEATRFTAGLSILGVLPPDLVIELLSARIAALAETLDSGRAELAELKGKLPRLFTVETEYGLTMLAAELEWTRAFRAELVDGTFPDLGFWRRMHAENIDPAEVFEMVERGKEPE
ncbi:PadR family transcriptional regulator [Nocardia goodfellowii]|uniref:DNA-binding PadR family transcriptional regulator n=1 Tax=Nocardia goodfellowii TaxID=882446 RepID=A0ABS4QRY8_9NOCA|nr:PadR family transcriptional regulator [Nocardia goodfellowii]MBP2194476.1 DNA-binding PadR family transcriptional regulator [Nocardia goodfellowii]